MEQSRSAMSSAITISPPLEQQEFGNVISVQLQTVSVESESAASCDPEMISLITDSLNGLATKKQGSIIQSLVMRCIDLMAASLLLILLAPLMVVVAIAIRLESRGPVFFLQERRGRYFKTFRMWKFRSMMHGIPDPTARYETKATDSRITRFGRFIRRTSIDELPQLFNVLIGNMSLVGPRPLVEWESIEAAKTHGERYLVLPGITGLSQVEVRNSEDLHTRLEKDAEYVRRKGIGLYLMILARTPWQILSPKMIYPDKV